MNPDYIIIGEGERCRIPLAAKIIKQAPGIRESISRQLRFIRRDQAFILQHMCPHRSEFVDVAFWEHSSDRQETPQVEVTIAD